MEVLHCIQSSYIVLCMSLNYLAPKAKLYINIRLGNFQPPHEKQLIPHEQMRTSKKPIRSRNRLSGHAFAVLIQDIGPVL